MELREENESSEEYLRRNIFLYLFYTGRNDEFWMDCMNFTMEGAVLSCVVLCFVFCVLCFVFCVCVFVLSCLVLSCLVLSCLVLSCLVLSCLVLSCLAPKCPLPVANACPTTARSAKTSSHGRPRGSKTLPKTTCRGHLNETWKSSKQSSKQS
jgi:hypothetical protein